MTNSKRTFLLCVLDGLGLNPREEGNAVAKARKPNFDRLSQSCPFTTLTTHGERVGLPEGQMGNSEVGHLNIGAGRVVEQWLLRISNALKKNSLASTASYAGFLKNLSGSSRIHVMGLFSDGGVHSHSDHLYLLLERLSADFKGEILLHLITDGRDTSPHRAGEQIADLERFLAAYPRIHVATLSGRFHAMDRDKRWERTEIAFRAVVSREGAHAPSARAAIEAAYKAGVTDEFIEPCIIGDPTAPYTPSPTDGFIFYNFREDRARQIVGSLCSQDFSGFPRARVPFDSSRTLGFTEYDAKLHLPFLFEPIEIKNHLGDVISAAGLTQLRTAETEKYPHVTYFLNGGVETILKGEERRMVPSPRDVKTYDLKPEMSAREVTNGVVQAIESRAFDVIVVNLANCDMVGHTGVFDAAVKAVETADECLGRMITALEATGGEAIIIADHGNAEQMIDYETGAPFTSHTTFPVPCIVVGHPGAKTLRPGGALCDVAPTLLAMMGLKKPAEMTGTSLL
jgi:2,3-bisphosphoglycerate-independent phosphoglycerate mutase